MLKAIGSCLKILTFSILVLILGNWFKWDGRTISDQVKFHMAHAERSETLNTVREWAQKITHEASKGAHIKSIHFSSPMTVTVPEEISPSERQKLRALIQELNSSHKKD